MFYVLRGQFAWWGRIACFYTLNVHGICCLVAVLDHLTKIVLVKI